MSRSAQASLSVADGVYSAARWFVAAIIVRIGWEVGGWTWMKLAS
jgi:hypothetical protein